MDNSFILPFTIVILRASRAINLKVPSRTIFGNFESQVDNRIETVKICTKQIGISVKKSLKW
jgi:hypothetical protein